MEQDRLASNKDPQVTGEKADGSDIWKGNNMQVVICKWTKHLSCWGRGREFGHKEE